MDDSRPIFIQIAEAIEGDILRGVLIEGEQIPSINELAAFHRINPATALKGVNRLVEEGIVAKRRGVGMFVTIGSRDRLTQSRRETFATQYLRPLIIEAQKLGISIEDLAQLLRNEGKNYE